MRLPIPTAAAIGDSSERQQVPNESSSLSQEERERKQTSQMSQTGTRTSGSSEAATSWSRAGPLLQRHFLTLRVRNESFSLKHLGAQQDGSNALLSLNCTLCLRAFKSEDAAAKFTQSAA